MADPFAAALAVLHRAGAPGTVAADYTPVAGMTRRIQVVRGQATREVTREGDILLEDVNSIQIRRADVAQPENDDLVDLIQFAADGVTETSRDRFTIQGGAKLDAEGVTWNCWLAPL